MSILQDVRFRWLGSVGFGRQQIGTTRKGMEMHQYVSVVEFT